MSEAMILFAPVVITAPSSDLPILAPDFHPDQLGVPYYIPSTTTCFQDTAGTIPIVNTNATTRRVRRINSLGVTGIDLIAADNTYAEAFYNASTGLWYFGSSIVPTHSFYTKNPAALDYVRGTTKVAIASNSVGLSLTGASNNAVLNSTIIAELAPDNSLAIRSTFYHKGLNGPLVSRQSPQTPYSAADKGVIFEADFAAKRQVISQSGSIVVNETYSDPTAGPSIDDTQDPKLGWIIDSVQTSYQVKVLVLSNRMFTDWERINLMNWMEKYK